MHRQNCKKINVRDTYLYNNMKSYQPLLLILLLTISYSIPQNTTKFWQDALNETQLHFQAYAGYQQIDWFRPKGQSGIYYHLFGASGRAIDDEPSTVPLIIWLNGGPGSSSLFGAYTELGPIRIINKKPRLFSYPWNIFGHLLFIDQPLNVGFSYSGNRTGTQQVRSAREAGQHLLNFLSNFYKEWPRLKACPLYITGESFAGHYIPAFARSIIMNSTFKQETGVKLEGVAIGDGWVDPLNQLNYYDSLLYSAGIVSNKFRDICTWFQTQSIVNIYRGALKNATSYWDFLTNNEQTWKTYLGGMSQFNFRQFEDTDGSFAQFLQESKESLGVKAGVDYIPGNDKVYQAFHQDISISYASDIIIMLRHTKLLIYNGQEDYVINTAGVLNYLNSLDWERLPQWQKAKKEVWTVNNKVQGWAKTYGNLWFVLVNKAGHMVPTDNPSAAFSMMGHFITNNRNWQE